MIQDLLCKCSIFYAFSQHIPTVQCNFQVLVAGGTEFINPVLQRHVHSPGSITNKKLGTGGKV
jgi:hypothetical protein